MTEAVVDELELVDIEKQHRDFAECTLGSGEGVVETVDEQRAVGKSGERIRQRLADRVGGSCRRDRNAGVFGEECERLRVGFGEPAVGHGGDYEAPHDCSVAVDWCRHCCPQSGCGERLNLACVAAVVVRDRQPLLDDCSAADPLGDRAAPQDPLELVLETRARCEHNVRWIVLVDQS